MLKDKEYAFLLVDDHPVIRSVLRQIINKITGYKCRIDEVSSLSELYETIEHERYDMAILDVHLDDGTTLTELALFKKKQPGMKILYFSVCPEEIYAQRLIQMGADGFLNKKAPEDEISEAILKILSGRRYLSLDFIYALTLNPETHQKAHSNPFTLLTSREFEVLTLILNGRNNKEISELISLSASTISTHKARIFEKLGVVNDMELSKIASNYGIATL